MVVHLSRSRGRPGGRYGDADSLDFDRFAENVGAIMLGTSSYAWLARELTQDGSGSTWPYSQPPGS